VFNKRIVQHIGSVLLFFGCMMAVRGSAGDSAEMRLPAISRTTLAPRTLIPSARLGGSSQGVPFLNLGQIKERLLQNMGLLQNAGFLRILMIKAVFSRQQSENLPFPPRVGG
jgi:hypothetical protein